MTRKMGSPHMLGCDWIQGDFGRKPQETTWAGYPLAKNDVLRWLSSSLIVNLWSILFLRHLMMPDFTLGG